MQLRLRTCNTENSSNYLLPNIFTYECIDLHLNKIILTSKDDVCVLDYTFCFFNH